MLVKNKTKIAIVNVDKLFESDDGKLIFFTHRIGVYTTNVSMCLFSVFTSRCPYRSSPLLLSSRRLKDRKCGRQGDQCI